VADASSREGDAMQPDQETLEAERLFEIATTCLERREFVARVNAEMGPLSSYMMGVLWEFYMLTEERR
jgi:hypothetical protein